MRLLRLPELAAGLLALVLGLLHWWLAPGSGSDLTAQLARASFARAAPFTPVDLSWYGGVHPYGYSLLSPWVMALLGVQLAGLVAAAVATVLLARLVRDGERPLAAALLGALLITGNLVTGRITFALGLAAGLAALLALPRRRAAAALGVLTALLSPVAAAFLGLVAAVLVLARRPGGWTLGIACSAPVLLLAWLFPAGGVQPFTTRSSIPAVLLALTLAWLTRVPLVRGGALLYALAVVVLVNHADPFGSNVLRLGLVLAAPVLLATVRHRLLPLALAGCLLWQAWPPVGALRTPDAPSMSGLRAELERLGAHRVEVVAPLDHPEAAFVAERVPLARGWARQQDEVLNPLFYKANASPPQFLGWLHDHAVDHVAVPRHGPRDFGARHEDPALLVEVWRDTDWVLYAVPDPQPLAAPADILSSTRTALTLRVVPGIVEVVVRWSRWLSLTGPACLERSGDQVRLRVTAPGTVVLSSSLLPRGHC